MLEYILLSTFIVSLLSLVGIFTIAISDILFKKIILPMVSFAAGILIGASFLHLLPESVENLKLKMAMTIFIVGFSSFYLLERILRWRHCHEDECEVHPVTYLALIGDSIHNFIDGIIIAASYLVDFKLGLLTTFAVASHELPQELGDFSVLVFGGFSKKKALLFNFLTALTAVFGAVVGFYALKEFDVTSYLLAFAAGNFAYVASSDLIPELHKVAELKRSAASFLLFVLGVTLMYLLTQGHP